MKKVLVHENESKFEAVFASINGSLIPMIQKIADAYNALEIGDFELSVVNDLLSGGRKTRKKYLGKVEANLKKAGIRGAALRSLIQESEADLEPLRISSLGHDGTLLGYLSVVEGKVVVTKESEEELRNRFRVFLSDPEAIRIYNIHKEIIERLNEIAGIVKSRYSGGHYYNVCEIRDLLITANIDEERFEMGKINYDFLVGND